MLAKLGDTFNPSVNISSTLSGTYIATRTSSAKNPPHMIFVTVSPLGDLAGIIIFASVHVPLPLNEHVPSPLE